MSDIFRHIASELIDTANQLHARGWLLGTSGNLSAVVEPNPLQLAITPSGADKGELSVEQILLIDEQSKSIGSRPGKPSDESSLHVVIARVRGAGAVVHTHSVWTTILSDIYFSDKGFAIEGYEMLKGLTGVPTHLHREWIPIIENSQDMPLLSRRVYETLEAHPEAHSFVLNRHGLYTWGRDLKEARRHVEILEFLFEVLGRSRVN